MKIAEKLRNKKYLPEEDNILQTLLKIIEKNIQSGKYEMVFTSSALSASAINYLWSEGFKVKTFNRKYHIIEFINKKYVPEDDAILQNVLKILEKKSLEGNTEFMYESRLLSPSAINYLWSEGFVINKFHNHHYLISW